MVMGEGKNKRSLASSLLDSEAPTPRKALCQSLSYKRVSTAPRWRPGTALVILLLRRRPVNASLSTFLYHLRTKKGLKMADMEVDTTEVSGSGAVEKVEKKGKGSSDKKRFEVKKVWITITFESELRIPCSYNEICLDF